MNWIRYLLDKEEFLAATLKEYSFVSGEGQTLWDALWEEFNSYSGGGGILGDFFDKEREYIAEQAKEGGDSRESFLEWCGYCKHCERGKEVTEENEEELREEYARAQVDDDMGCFTKAEADAAKTRASKFLVPLRLDGCIEDPDDDLGVAIFFNIVPYTDQQKARLHRLANDKNRKKIVLKKAVGNGKGRTLDEHDFWQRVFAAQWLIQRLEKFTTVKDEALLGVSDVEHLCDCSYPLDPSEVELDPGACPFVIQQIECPHCGTSVDLREARARAAAILDQPGGQWLYTKAGRSVITTNTPPLPFENNPEFATTFVTRVKPMQHRLLRRLFTELAEKNPFWHIHSSHDRLTDGVPVVYYPDHITGLTDGHDAVSMTVFTDGVVRIGPAYHGFAQGGSGDSGESRFYPDETDILFARTVLLQAGFKEFSEDLPNG